MKLSLLTATALTILAISPITSANAQMDAKKLSVKADTVREENAYNYEYNRDEQGQVYYWVTSNPFRPE